MMKIGVHAPDANEKPGVLTSEPYRAVPVVGLKEAAGEPMQARFSPYVNNGGTVLAIAGDDFVVVVGDTRMSTGYSIHTREQSKITKLTDKCVIATAGMQSEMITLHKMLKYRVAMYEHEHRRQPSVEAIAQMLSTMLYYKRFFPYYTFNLIAGVDDNGKGAVYGYDAIGSHERSMYGAQGTGNSLMMSVLDNQIGKNNQEIPTPPLTKLQVIDLAKDAITSAGERDIYTGDGVDVVVIDGAGFSATKMPLKKD
eukprot:GDKI01037310.1.p1 GENE.GDKI01037310.1~~GDKI01037310.1.p1  ORF type:complete len:274 (-),score=111.52 GDKI01037310.1:235-996(-)